MKFKMMAAALGLAAGVAMSAPVLAQSKLQCKPGETYVMNVMVSAHPYWVPIP